MKIKTSSLLLVLKLVVLATLIFSNPLNAQVKQKEYLSEWKKIDSLLQKAGLPKSALIEVNAIYNAAKRENNDAQVIKALIYRMNINDQLSEENKYENIAALENEIKTAKEPARSILSSLAGGSYWHYLQLNRWQFYNRTRTITNDSNNIASWDISQLYERISHHFQNSIKNSSLLQKTKLEKFDPIIVKGNVRNLRPTLYDLLAHRALEYFRNDERYVTKPSYAFRINDTLAFADAPIFVKHRFQTLDTASLHYQALLLYQQLIQFRLNDNNKAALLDADLGRISFVYNFGDHDGKESLYKNSLEKLIRNNDNVAGVSYAMFMLAQWYYTQGNRYQTTGDSTAQYALRDAKNWCERALKADDKKHVHPEIAALLNEITAPSIAATTEKVNVPGTSFRTLLTFRNSRDAYFKIIKVTEATRQSFLRNQWNDTTWQSIVAADAVRKFNYALPATDDYQPHRVETKVDPLPSGEYALLVSNNNNFSMQNGSLSLVFFYVSNIAYVHSEEKYYLLNRNTGKPLAGADVTTWKEEYNYSTQKNNLRKIGSYKSDNNGFFLLRKNNDRNNVSGFRMEIKHGGDKLFLDDQAGYPFYYETPKPSEQTYLFTDRALYRPGQIAYFKGIRVMNNQQSQKIVTNKKSIIELINANGELIDSVTLVSNEFGSYNGRFTIPSGGLNGQFRIRDRATASETNINVEEYKRPRFYVELKQPKGTYRLNDSISVELSAMSYAGTAVNNGTVNYRVVRRTEIPMWNYGSGYLRIWPPYPTQQMEIAHGTLDIEPDGKARISFLAIPDPSIREDQQPIFNYDVYADVTDVTGETRSSIINVPVAYRAMKLRLSVPEIQPADSLNKIMVFSTNLVDSFEATKVTIAIHKLKSPARLFRERLWEQPDRFLMTKEEYYKEFPFDQYADETDMTKWAKEKLVLETSANTNAKGEIPLSAKNLDAGWYLVEVSTVDKYKSKVVDKKYMQLTRNNKLSPLFSAALLINNNLVATGDTLKYQLMTNLEDPYIISELITTADSSLQIEQKSLSRNLKISGKHTGPITIKVAVVKNNRVYNDYRVVAVSGNDTSIKIELATYRDKMEPSKPEKWKVKISGTKNEKVTAELLTSMYDASLDQFYKHSWPTIYRTQWRPDYGNWKGENNFTIVSGIQKYIPQNIEAGTEKIYDRLVSLDEGGAAYIVRSAAPRKELQGAIAGVQIESAQAAPSADAKKEQAFDQQKEGGDAPSVQPRKNLNETAFFFPDLKTDADGNVKFSFTAPEALTTWKWMLFAHTPSLQTSSWTQELITQKKLMVQPNLPRFIRQGDQFTLVSKISNLTNTSIKGNVSIVLKDPISGENVSGKFKIDTLTKTFSVAADQSIPVYFTVTVPLTYDRPLTWQIIASSTTPALSDGEESTIAVLSNRTLVTETLPLLYRGKGVKQFSFEKLLQSGSSSTIKNHALTVEYTSNPAWYAVQALPYLTETENENAEQVFNRFYANALAAQLANSTPRLKQVIAHWSKSDTAAFFSNLQKNEELKAVMLQETPWVLAANSETKQKKNIALLFDVNRMSNDLSASLSKLAAMQVESGGFVWYPGAPEDRYMTQYIITGIGKLRKLHAVPPSSLGKIEEISKKALRYLDQQIKKDYQEARKQNNKIPGSALGNIQVQYLYMRSFFTSRVAGDVFPAYNFFRNEARKNWTKESNYMKAMIALSLHRSADLQTAKKIVTSLKETSIQKEETGMYWKDMSGGYYWYQAPVETQSVMIECFGEIDSDSSTIDELKTWLLKNKQTNNWKTSRATADACYALLLRGNNWLTDEPALSIKLGNRQLDTDKQQEGTGYFKTVIPADSVRPGMGKIAVSVKDNSAGSRPSWGAVYWQYFEDLDKITNAETGLKITKRVMIQRNTDKGPLLDTMGKNNTLKIGDRVKIRIEIRSDRNLEYVHMKDMRAAGFEPVNVISGYRWRNGLGFYESTKDASVNYYFSFLPKGVHIFEYDLFATQAGNFNNGITNIQCMYAPEFSSHSEGIKVNVKER